MLTILFPHSWKSEDVIAYIRARGFCRYTLSWPCGGSCIAQIDMSEN